MNIANFDLNLLRVLDAMLRETSTVKAGRRVGLSQPAVSAALGRLRHATRTSTIYRPGVGMGGIGIGICDGDGMPGLFFMSSIL